MGFRDYSKQVEGRIHAASTRAMTRIAMEVANQAKRNAVRGFSTHPTGQLEASLDYEVVNAGLGTVARIGATAKYARIQELGGTIHGKPWLVFEAPKGSGEWHTVESVTIPARPYLRPAVLTVAPKAPNYFREEMSRG